MTIRVTGIANGKEYKTICTDKDCRAILEFTQSDISWNKVYSMGREAGEFEGIVCPCCNQVLKIKDFEEMRAIS